MFITREAILERTGVAVDQQTLASAQMMVEAYIGRTEIAVSDAGDKELLARATMFQAVYINGQTLDIMEQAAIRSTTLGESTMAMNLELMAPFMSPFAVLSCKRLTWMGSRSVHTGRIFDRAPAQPVWERD